MAYLFLLFFSSFFGSPSLLSFSVFSDVPFNISFSSLSISCFLSASSLPLASSVFSERPPEIPTEPFTMPFTEGRSFDTALGALRSPSTTFCRYLPMSWCQLRHPECLVGDVRHQFLLTLLLQSSWGCGRRSWMCSYRPVHALVTCATVVQYTGVASHTSLISSTAKYASVGTPTSFGCTSTMTSSGFGVYRLNKSLISKSLALSFGPDCGPRTILMGPCHPPRTELFAPGQRHVKHTNNPLSGAFR
ncbi:hypothetical protein KC367_g103 [Hortaea werneckii]|nr:hypothetical protein KC367_g103 [Hortaea werneckii]